MATADRIPVVDFQRFKEGGGRDNPVVKALHEAFTTVGFVFLTNTGIDPLLVERVFKAGDDFFALPESTKLKYKSLSGNGYIPFAYERRNGLLDLVENYVLHDTRSTASNVPTEDSPSFWPTLLELFEACKTLSLQVLEAIAYALNLENPQFFDQHVRPFIGNGMENTFTNLRLNHFPPLSPKDEITPGRLRMGEHVDFCCVTLLFTDRQSGLQVKRRDGGFIDAPHIPNAVIVNLGALIQRWTADAYIATKHRVAVPPSDAERQLSRRSIAFFCHPGRKVKVECLDGSGKYPPIIADEDTTFRYNQQYDNPDDFV